MIHIMNRKLIRGSYSESKIYPGIHTYLIENESLIQIAIPNESSDSFNESN